MTASRLRTFVFLTGALLAGGIAQAQQPSQSSTPAAATPAAAVTAASPAPKPGSDITAAASKPADADAAQKAADAKLVNDARNAGFRPQMIRGTQMFCRTAKELGSNFPVRTCYDADQVKIKIAEYAEQRNQLEQLHSSGMITH